MSAVSAVVEPLRRFTRNPVLRREMDQRMRSKGGAMSITLWLVLLSGIFLITYGANVAISDQFNTGAVVNVGRIGRELFEWTLSGMMALILFLVPAFTSSAIAGERERQTLLPLQVTLLSPLSIVGGKIAAALVFTVLLLVLSTPLLAISFLVGGVTVFDVIKAMLMLMVTALLVGSIGVAISSRVRRVVTATVLSYGVILLLCIGSFVGLGVWAIVEEIVDNNPSPPKELIAMNPFVATADVFDPGPSGLGFRDTTSPMGWSRDLLDSLDNEDWWFDERDAVEQTSVWRWYLTGTALITYLSVGFATRQVRAPAETER